MDDIDVRGFVESRAKEMKLMLEVVKEITGNDAPQQRLPRHMRRRAANHNVKRLPVVVRQKLAKDMLAVPKKRPSRKHRRRPKNLFQEYEKRSSKKRWLETHIWHAKRFHMSELWNCKIALRRNDRGNRAAYRDSRKECLLCDVSWLNCIEINGLESNIISFLELFLYNPNPTSVLFNNQVLMGQSEIEVLLYKKIKNHHIPIGTAKLLWKFDVERTTKRSLWLWIHPACFNELMDSFKEKLNISKEEENVNKFSNGIIDIFVRTKDFSRFRLIGPKSQSVLFMALKLSNLNGEQFKQDYVYNVTEHSFVEAQHLNWQALKCANPAALPPHSTHGLLVGDPRLNMPVKRLNSEQNEIPTFSDASAWQNFQPQLSFSSIWNRELAKKLKAAKMSTHEMNELRAGSLLTKYDPTIPVLLIQNPGKRDGLDDTGLGAGWDVVIPSGWGMAFWIGLVYRGARTIGLQELKHIDYEMHNMTFPDFYPDSKSGKELDLSNYQSLASKYKRMPPSKCPNYQKLGVLAPFNSPWSELCQEWHSKSNPTSVETIPHDNPFFVIRDIPFLKELSNKLLSLNHSVEKTTNESKLKPVEGVTRRVTVKGTSRSYIVKNVGVKKLILEKSFTRHESQYFFEKADSYSLGLVPVVIEMADKGALEKFSMICLPLPADYQAFVDGKRDILEPAHKGEKKRKVYSITNVDEPVTGLLGLCSRPTFGFSVYGGFSYSQSKGVMIGFVSLPGLLDLVSLSQPTCYAGVDRQTVLEDLKFQKINHSNLVMVRSSRSLQYRFATLKIITDVCC